MHLPLLLASVVQISISSRGVLKVTHMLTLAGGSAMAVEAPHPLGTFSTQAGGKPWLSRLLVAGSAFASCLNCQSCRQGCPQPLPVRRPEPPSGVPVVCLPVLQNNADRTCVAQFIIMPHDEEVDADGFAGEDD